ncbi:hypothetical protein SCD_n02318 [Sulfuricella denitrificans skB26]|uniref:Uncharacterized protein n=1 Tax=Sulfuricella denitrificans (strain DSM 22764 / NBRC 105220 / skB26) TaxID=1163617 RepID=S6AIP5_SULDS|nr:hypothetical protein [Sulfuricella denitrificans]BAN36126.1 hypothetical protein SCD_n02318 [Sulfuricella denitrificans skB26]
MSFYSLDPNALNMNQSRIAHCIEVLCQKGCKEVSLTILALERGEPMAEVQELNEDERQVVLNELKSIMAVYQEDGTCR